MPLAFIFWLLMLLWVVFTGWYGFRPDGDRAGLPGSFLLFLLFVVVGLKLFGAPISG